MADQIVSTQSTLLAAEAVAVNVTAEEYMQQYAADRHEWVRGVVINVSPASMRHYELVLYLTMLFKAYFKHNPIGTVVGQPIVMRVDATQSRREPDLQLIFNSNPGQLTETAMIGPADICIEVVSSESIARDHGIKFEEYQLGGVGEYWIIDPLRDECRFCRLNTAGIYVTQSIDETGNYSTPILPHFRLHVPTLWQKTLPDIEAVVQQVQEMFG